MPNQAPAQLNHSFTHSFTLNNNNLMLFGFLSYFCCLSLSLSLALFRRPPALPPLSTARGGRRKERDYECRHHRGKGRFATAKPNRPNRRGPRFLSPPESIRKRRSICNDSPKRGRSEWGVGKVGGAKQNTDGDEKGGERKGPSGSRSRLRRRWLGRCSEGRTRDGAFFLERPKVKAIFPCRRGQCRTARARQGIFSATSSSRRRRGWY